MDLLARLVTSAGSRLRFNVGDSDASEVAAEFIHLLKRAAELYRETVDPMLEGIYLRREFTGEVPAQIMDVADHLAYVDSHLDEFFLEVNPVM